MYSRSRQNQNNYNARNSNNQGQFSNPNNFNQPGTYQTTAHVRAPVPPNQQFNQQQKPMHQGNVANQPVRPPQPLMQLGGQQIQQPPKLIPGNQTPQTPQRLKPILKQPSAAPQNVEPTPQPPPQQQPAQPPSLRPPHPQSQPPPPPSPQPQQTQQTQIQPEQPQPVVNAPPTAVEAPSDGIKDESQPTTENRDVEMTDGPQPRWRRKAPGFKVNKKLKRLRMNQRLRKTVQPKNAIMVLNEMKAGVQFTFPENSGNMQNSLYVVHAELDGKTYVGQGLSKPLARQNAAENALKALLLEKMTAASMKARMDAESDGQNQSMEVSVKDDNMDESQTSQDTSTDENDDIPWGSLASFAMYKLFLEWHNQGTSVPVPRPGVSPPTKAMKKDVTKPPLQKELPPNATTIHPVMLLNQMRPGLIYMEMDRQGTPPNIMFTLSVTVDGMECCGTAKNKKDAKKSAAKAALEALYGLVYPEKAKNEAEDAPMIA